MKWFLLELQGCTLLYQHELAYINFLYDCHVTRNEGIKPSDLGAIDKLYKEVQKRKGYGTC